jgi:hypothetical protein
MATADTVPITLSAEAAARIAELGMQREFEEIVEHARTDLPGVTRIEVYLDGPYDEPKTPDKVYVDAYRPPLEFKDEESVRDEMIRWWIERPLRTRMEFLLVIRYEETDAQCMDAAS